MNRDIKFRYWCKDNASYEYIDTVFSIGELVMHNTGLYRIDEWSGYSGGGADVTNETERYIVEQYTGLTDKNGKEIYEGDILCWDDRRDLQWTVEWNSMHDYTDWHSVRSKPVVCGNIHEGVTNETT